jgi:LPXTG-motif cell wall-anchored protein
VPAANAPALVTSANQSQLTSSPGEGKALVNGVATKVEVAQIDIPAADKAPSERSATEVREVQVAAKELVDDLNDLLPSGATPPAVVVNTNTGAVITGVVKNISVPVEDVLVVKTSDQAVLVAGVNKSGTEVAPVGKIGGPEIDEGGQVAAIAYGLNPGDSGEFIVMSTPTLLSSFTVETNGTFREQAVLPVGLTAGRHTLVVATPKVAVSFGFTIVAVTELPATGSATSIPMGTWAFGLLFSGLCLAILVRRRRTGLFN